MKNFFWATVLILYNTPACNAQEKYNKELSNFQRIIHLHFYNSPFVKEKKPPDSLKFEILFFIMRTDSDGKAESINLFSDAANTDVGYSIFKQLTLKDFSNWKTTAAINKTLIIPLTIIGNIDPPNHIESFIKDFSKLGNQSSNIVNIPGINFYWPDKKKN